jgi:hypothetical protein
VAIIEVGMMAKTQAWDQVEALAQAFTQRPRFFGDVAIRKAPPPSVEDLILTHSRQGSRAASGSNAEI